MKSLSRAFPRRLNSIRYPLQLPLFSMSSNKLSSTSRLSQISQHLHSTSSNSANTDAEKLLRERGGIIEDGNIQADSKKSPSVNSQLVNNLRVITLENDKLNALDTPMINEMITLLQKYEQSPTAKIVILRGEGRAFCAGGDVVTLVKHIKRGASHHANHFFRKEYSLDSLISRMETPVISFLDGITMGGGVGISIHAPFRIATEKTRFAMPETTIGLFPDVGASFFLSRMEGMSGLYLGLTSDELRGYSTYKAGIATHYIPSQLLPEVIDSLSKLNISAPTASDPAERQEQRSGLLGQISRTLNLFASGKGGKERSEKDMAGDLAGFKRFAIDICFGVKSSVSDILNRLDKLSKWELKELGDEITKLHSSQDPNRLKYLKVNFDRFSQLLQSPDVQINEVEKQLRDWAAKTKKIIELRSPISCEIALQQFWKARKLNIQEVFEMDLILADKCCDLSVHKDFVTGVTARLITKTNDPVWSEAVPTSSITETYFPPLPDPPVVQLPETPTLLEPYKEYPWAPMSLPSENAIGRYVRGERLDSGSFALTEQELIALLKRDWKALGGVDEGVEEKVKEVVWRCCVTGTENEERALKWFEGMGDVKRGNNEEEF